ncbi:hypothetical protein [Rubrimonas cliftonensis]|uniref:Uncharacterized protein n=1 Tax=Rubrimonas cliftonensis TaxID=89524 RepID=A0A1H3Z5Y7_9RHOB|nr:hypothetical protein [Rubrimonas cliftonensis]SEA18672.1 hypothetical protein SAMN05444370_103390 [Rubrimonas cliftonensis]
MSGEGAFWRYLVGVLAAQVAAAAAILAATGLASPALQAALAGGTLVFGAGVAWAFGAIARSERRVQAALTEARLAREREKLAVSLERRRATEARSDALATTQAVLDQSRTRAASLRWGLAGGGAVGVGVALLAAQFVTLGLVAITLAGGAALGWRLRPRRAIVDVTPSPRGGLLDRVRAAAPRLFGGAGHRGG